jgi:hypothetical protein
MKRFIPFFVLMVAALGIAGCGNGPAHAENVTAQIKSMSPEDRFALIRDNTGMSRPMKERAIDDLPVSEEQKSAWKAELK